MSNIDKQALREAAEKAGADEWCAFIDTKSKTYSVHTPGDNRCGDVVKWAGFDGQQRAAAKAKFIAAANPATVLALLDELEVVKAVQQTALEYTAGIENQLEDALARIVELSSDVIAPGIMRCAGCGFVLTKNSINMATGTITAGDSKTETCPNGCGPLRPVTWKEQALEMRDSSEKWFEELQESRKVNADLTMLVKRLAHSLKYANQLSKLPGDAMDYLSRNGLISVEDVLR